MEETKGKQIVCRKTDMIREVSWSELVADLLGDIIGRLCLADLVRFRAVCKTWRDAKPITNTGSTSRSMLSWLVSVGSRNQKPTRALECRLFDPSCSVDEPVSVQTIISFTELGIPVRSWSRIRTFCKQGWLFIAIREIPAYPHSRIYFVLFSPLTKELNQLPPLPANSSYFQQTFSSDPESVDCVFLLLHSRDYHEITVKTCRKGDTEWTVRTFRVEDFQESQPMYTRGLFYIICRYGQLASYNVNEEELKYENLDRDGDFAGLGLHQQYRVFTINGELMYKYLCNGAKRFDWSNKVWVPVSSLTDPPAFIGNDRFAQVEDMIEFPGSECRCSSKSSSLLDHLMYRPSEFVFDSGSINQFGTDSFFWLEPPLLHD